MVLVLGQNELVVVVSCSDSLLMHIFLCPIRIHVGGLGNSCKEAELHLLLFRAWRPWGNVPGGLSVEKYSGGRWIVSQIPGGHKEEGKVFQHLMRLNANSRHELPFVAWSVRLIARVGLQLIFLNADPLGTWRLLDL